MAADEGEMRSGEATPYATETDRRRGPHGIDMVPLDAPAAALAVLERLVREIEGGGPRQEADLDFAA